MTRKIVIEDKLMNKFISTVKQKYPKKAFGYFLSDKPNGDPTDFVIFNNDVRDDIKDVFETYGNYYKRNHDAGFLCTEEEMFKVHKKIMQDKKFIVGVYHSHQRHPAIFSKVDVDFHPGDGLWHLIISLRNFDYPQIKAFEAKNEEVIEIPIIVSKHNDDNLNSKEYRMLQTIKDVKKTNSIKDIYECVKQIFGFNENGQPNVTNGEVLYKAWKLIQNTSKKLEEELMFERFYKNSNDRYCEFIKPIMKKIEPEEFMMGTNNSKIKYCGESPMHKVTLNPFFITATTITNYIYSKYDPYYKFEGDLQKPATGVTWYDAVMLSKWFGCRIATEAEWEYASCKLKDDLWCCHEDQLCEYAWYSENSDGVIHKVAQLKPNKFGLFDMHGNTWEWTLDSYSEDYYEFSLSNNPENNINSVMKVLRGGSIHGFSEMCRSSFRYYEPANYSSYDISFRLVKDI